MSNSIIDDLKSRYHHGNAIIRLIMLNVIVHLVVLLAHLVVFLFNGPDNSYWAFIEKWFFFPSEIAVLPYRIWTIFTYMFLHGGVWHLFSNMLILYIFGEKLNDLLPNQKILPIYLWGGIIGALVFLIGYNTFPAFANWPHKTLVGASASVMAVVLAAATLNPKGEIRPFGLFSIQLQYVALIWILINLLVTLPGDNPGGALAHLGGAFMGWFFVHSLRKGRDLSQPVDKVLNIFNRSNNNSKNYPKKEAQQETLRSKMKVHKGSSKTDYYGSEYGRSFMQKYKDMSREECLNTILDNIKRSGYDGLTEDEKAFLDRYRDH